MSKNKIRTNINHKDMPAAPRCISGNEIVEGSSIRSLQETQSTLQQGECTKHELFEYQFTVFRLRSVTKSPKDIVYLHLGFPTTWERLRRDKLVEWTHHWVPFTLCNIVIESASCPTFQVNFFLHLVYLNFFSISYSEVERVRFLRQIFKGYHNVMYLKSLAKQFFLGYISNNQCVDVNRLAGVSCSWPHPCSFFVSDKCGLFSECNEETNLNPGSQPPPPIC